VTAYDGKSKGAEAYNALAREFVARDTTSRRRDAEAQKKESIS
jgi:hypothetical protein